MTQKEDRMILDYIDNLSLSETEEENHYDALMALARLGEGLFWINKQIAQYENEIRKEAEKDDIQLAMVGGVLENKPLGIMSCAFQWYAISACNYAQLIGWLITKNTEASKTYIRKVMPRLLNFRNKVAAHMAITNPYPDDNEADLAASVKTQIIYVKGRLFGAAFTPIIIKQNELIKINKDISWSLTLAHERLKLRYWPNAEPKSYQSIQVPPGETKFKISWSDLTQNDM
jgi:hypothetical protein